MDRQKRISGEEIIENRVTNIEIICSSKTFKLPKEDRKLYLYKQIHLSLTLIKSLNPFCLQVKASGAMSSKTSQIKGTCLAKISSS